MDPTWKRTWSVKEAVIPASGLVANPAAGPVRWNPDGLNKNARRRSLGGTWTNQTWRRASDILALKAGELQRGRAPASPHAETQGQFGAGQAFRMDSHFHMHLFWPRCALADFNVNQARRQCESCCHCI